MTQVIVSDSCLYCRDKAYSQWAFESDLNSIYKLHDRCVTKKERKILVRLVKRKT